MAMVNLVSSVDICVSSPPWKVLSSVRFCLVFLVRNEGSFTSAKSGAFPHTFRPKIGSLLNEEKKNRGCRSVRMLL